jgi:ribosome-associated translation inhibitor RaiA
MKTDPQIAFHQMPTSPALEAHIRRAVDGLETHFDRMTGCRVSVEAPHRHHRHGRLYRVVIEIGMPGGRVVVGRSPDEHAAHSDAHVAVRDAFRAARRRLDDRVRHLSPEQSYRSS